MAVTCPNCGRDYDITLFQFGHKVECECGTLIDATRPLRLVQPRRQINLAESLARLKMSELQRMSERICALILNPEYPEIDIEIEKTRVRERCEQLFPDRMDLYEMIYESRFKRLWDQFRAAE